MKRSIRWLLLSLVLFWLCAQAADDEPEWLYTMRPGDNLWSLAQRYLGDGGASVKLQRYNQIDAATKIPPGTRIHIPLSWMQQQPAVARVVQLRGDVVLQHSGRQPEPLTLGGRLWMGDSLELGEAASVTIELADGSRLLLGPGSHITMDRLSAYGDTGMVDSRFRLQRGRVESRVRPLKGPGSRYEISTPAAVTLVRGTDFRVGVESGSGISQSEVVKGEVAVNAAGESVKLKAGFGTRIEPGKPPLAPRPLLPPPDLSALPERLDAVAITLDWPDQKGAVGYRLQLLASGDDALLAAHQLEQSRIDELVLSPGRYQVRIRGIDGLGLEGLSSRHLLEVVKPLPAPSPEPEPQLRLEPPAFNGAWVSFRWNQPPKANHYRLLIISEQTGLPLFSRRFETTVLSLPLPPPGRYRVSVEAWLAVESRWLRSNLYRLVIPPSWALP
ncbi:FecR family protein [endosymbiont of Riftia pachyptila]|uniref:Putative exported LysM bacterial cell wall protein n=1 Tax=endosymbiont of Riftia pachyptila (vent Ph05) TaxID=1048808 RepID=G2DCA8_9GAMM|nr:FecR domain-containing protein [endosymbiont of Riftia pachyptila]EGV51777.1 putative exported LysM bacterial cell wall protein [endosymbiont of Riftia pachyptila (vent Ph05)]